MTKTTQSSISPTLQVKKTPNHLHYNPAQQGLSNNTKSLAHPNSPINLNEFSLKKIVQ
jgi:hypothetical protein